jgi:hypothetical protein
VKTSVGCCITAVENHISKCKTVPVLAFAPHVLVELDQWIAYPPLRRATYWFSWTRKTPRVELRAVSVYPGL